MNTDNTAAPISGAPISGNEQSGPKVIDHQAGEAASRPRRAWTTGLAALALVVAGAGAGASAYALNHQEVASFDNDLATTAIVQLKADDDPVEIKGSVAEIFGNKFVVADSGGRALVETGRAGEDGGLVKAGETVTVQGRFENGFLHATGLEHADGKVTELRPLPPRPPHGHGPMGGPDRGPEGGPEAPRPAVDG